MLCYWFVVGLIEKELVEEAGKRRQSIGRQRIGFRKVLLRFFFFVFCFLFFFLINIVLTWKIVGASKASVIYIYIDKIGNTFSLFVRRKIVPNLINPLVQIP